MGNAANAGRTDVETTGYAARANMRKVELIYLHALLAKTHEYLANRHGLPETFEAYETDEVGPYQIQCRKGRHETAARLLADRLAEEVGERSGDGGPVGDDGGTVGERSGDREIELSEA